MDVLQELVTDKKEYDELNRSLKKLKSGNTKDLDKKFHQLHDEAFDRIDCLDCANCCKTTSPIFRDVDIARLSKHLKMKPGVFIDTYMRLDNDGDYILKQSPCFFLGEDNKCSVYDHRPLACREYPHTNRKKMYQILNLTMKNTQVCPAVAGIVRELIKSS